MTVTTLYEQDFYLWLEATAKALREKRFEDLDRENLTEEIEEMGKSQKREAYSRLVTIIEHLLKLLYWKSEKERNIGGWQNTVLTQRRELKLLLNDSPSLKNYLSEIFNQCYLDAKKDVEKLAKVSIPDSYIFTIELILDSDYLPN